MSRARTASPPLPPEAKRPLRAMFLTLFIDLVGFSIIFPLFPSMLEYYREIEAPGSIFAHLIDAITRFSEIAGAPATGFGVIVLFGGVLGSLYSLLQFVCAPVFGAISDRVGRKPVLIISLSGILVSYVIWIFAGSFFLLCLSRILSGIMSANIATATAVVADVTTPQTRSKGMAMIGIAFGLGFILGPAIGGISSLLDLSAHFPSLAQFGVNPYSMPAAIAAGLTLINLLNVAFFFPETYRPGIRSMRRSINPLVLLRTQQYPGVTVTNWSYFLFLLAFSGMEFSLTFLATERLGFTPARNALMFLFVGLVLAGLQGTLVPRLAARLGDRRVAQQGLVCLAPGLVLIGVAGHFQQAWILFLGLFLLATGAAQATPCLTALASLYTPQEDQGRVLGIFRSLGALARALGPLIACVLYWRTGGSAAYYMGAASLVLPLLLLQMLPERSTVTSET